MIMGMLSHKHTQRFLTWITGAGVALLYPMSAYAQNMNIFAAENFIGTMVVKAITVINLLTWILFGFLNYLLDPRFIFDMNDSGQEGAFMEILNQIWQLSRDITNIGFAIALVAAAVVMIVKADKSVISDKVGSFVLTIILVNFSWFIPRVILDVANVATATVFGIPSLLNQAGGQQCKYVGASAEENCTAKGDGTYDCDCIIITNMQIFVDNWEDLDKQTAWDCPGNELFCYKYEKMEPDTVASYSAILNGLIVNHGRLRELGRVPASLAGGSKISELIVFIMRELLLLAFHIAFFFPLLAMTVAFFLRIPILWITMAFMPFYFLGRILPDSIKEITGDKMDEIMKQFLKAAFLPTIVAIPLSIGFIMINAGSQLTGNASAGISIRLFDGVSNLHQLLWMCMSMGVLWVGVFEALKDKGIMSKGVEGIQNYGQSLGSLAGKVALSTPLPVPGGNALKFFKDNHPAVLANAVERNGWKGLFDPNKGKQKDIEDSAKNFQPNQFRDLTKHLDALKTAIQNNDTGGQQQAYRELDRMGVKGVENTTDVDTFMKELEKNNNLNAGDKRAARAKVDEVLRATSTATPPPADPKTAAFATASTNMTGTAAAAANLRTEFNRLLGELKTEEAAGTANKAAEINTLLGVQIDTTNYNAARADLEKFLNDHIATNRTMDLADKTAIQTKINDL